MRYTPLPSNQTSAGNGFTIIEVLVALVLLGIAAMMTVRLTTQNQNALTGTRMQDTAIILAREKLFELETEGLCASTGKAGDFGDDYPTFKWKASAHATDIPEMYRLLLTISWKGKRDHHVVVEKLFRE